MTAAPAGGWVHKAEPEHACILPRIDNQTFVGSVWRCGDCGLDHEVIAVDQAGFSEKVFRPIPREVAEARIACKS